MVSQRYSFQVKGIVPPRNVRSKSMWNNQTEVLRLIELRQKAFDALNGDAPLSESIELFVKDFNFDDYQDDYKTKSAVERQFGIIGEALSKTLKEEPNISISHAPEIIGLRNRIIHAYNGINDTIIWAIITNHLPVLKREVNILLKKK